MTTTAYPLIYAKEENRITRQIQETDEEIFDLNMLKMSLAKQLDVLKSQECDMLLSSLCKSDPFCEFPDVDEQEKILNHFKSHLSKENYDKVSPGLFGNRSNVTYVSRLYNVPLPANFL